MAGRKLTADDAAPRELVLLHGLLCDARVWEGISRRLGDIADSLIVALAGLDSIEAMAASVLDAAPPRFTLCGHSMGGRVAFECWRQAPERIERLGLFDTAVHPKKASEAAGRMRLLKLAEEEGMDAVAREWLPPMLGEGARGDAALVADLLAMVSGYPVDEFRMQIEALLNRPDATSVLPTISVPTLLLVGEEDNWSPVQQHRDMQAQIENSELVIIRDAGHMAPVEDPDAVAQAMRTWLLRQQESSKTMHAPGGSHDGHHST